MSDLFDRLPAGCHHLENFIDNIWQMNLLAICRDHLRRYPLMTPTTKQGRIMSVKVSSWGKVGWFGRLGNYEYLDRHNNGLQWPLIPKDFRTFFAAAAVTAGLPKFQIDTVLMNWYPAEYGKLGKHQDNTEKDLKSPIITISLGDDCLFNVGSTDYSDKGVDITLKSGDVLVMSGQSRLAYHEVKALIPGNNRLMRDGGRISLTARKVFI